MWGSAGTGKTLILMEALKIILSKLLSQGRRVRILATGFYGYDTTELMNNFRNKYLVNMKNIEVMDLYKLCSELNIENNYEPPRDKLPRLILNILDKFPNLDIDFGQSPLDILNRVITSLSDKYRDTDIVTLLLVDEVWPSNTEQETPDWRELEVRENVIWLLGLSPRAIYATSTEVLPPVNNSVLTRHLVFKHRNCPQIRNFIKTIMIKTLFILE